MLEMMAALLLALGASLALNAYLNGAKKQLKADLMAAQAEIAAQKAMLQAAEDRTLIEQGNARLGAQEIHDKFAEGGWLRD